MDLTENKLRYYVAVAEHQSFSKAAKEFYISQTAITQQIQSLEDQLKVTLIDRSERPIRLTPEGKVFLKEAKSILGRMDQAVTVTRAASTGLTGHLRIGYAKGLERSDLSNRMREFHRMYPNVFLSCFRNSSNVLAADLKNRKADIVFSWDSMNLADEEDVAHQVVLQADLVAVLYSSHPFAGRKTLRRAELKNEPILFMSISSEKDSIGDAHYLELYQKAGFTPNIVMSSTDMESILMMVAAEEGISILPSYFTKKLDNADNLVFVPLEGEEEHELIDSFWLREKHNPALELFLDFQKWTD